MWEVDRPQRFPVDWFSLRKILPEHDGGPCLDKKDRESPFYTSRYQDWKPKTPDLSIKGLRNRRRIYEDISEVLDQIAGLTEEERERVNGSSSHHAAACTLDFPVS